MSMKYAVRSYVKKNMTILAHLPNNDEISIVKIAHNDTVDRVQIICVHRKPAKWKSSFNMAVALRTKERKGRQRSCRRVFYCTPQVTARTWILHPSHRWGCLVSRFRSVKLCEGLQMQKNQKSEMLQPQLMMTHKRHRIWHEHQKQLFPRKNQNSRKFSILIYWHRKPS